MPKGISKLTDSWKKEIGLANKGKPNYFKGKKRGPMSEEQKAKVSLSKKGQVSWNKDLTGLPPRHTTPHTEESRDKISLANKGRMPPNFKKSLRWLKRQVMIRDDYTCRTCPFREPEIMVVDHIISRAIKPELSEDMDNLQTLCPNCHQRKTIKDRKLIAEHKRMERLNHVQET